MSEDQDLSQDESCGGECSGCGGDPKERELARTLAGIKKTIIVLSGKGGVGKSTVAINLAVGLAAEGYRVGLLDVDIHGPSAPVMLGASQAKMEGVGEKLLPLKIAGVDVVSIGFLLESKDDALIWRGPMKAGVIKQFLSDVEWGPLDALVVDCPPGTGDEPLSVIQLLPRDRYGIVVTTPQEVAAADVRKSLNFCKKLSLPVLGLVENMSGFVCPHCQTLTEVFNPGGGERIAKEFDLPLLAKLPLDPGVGSGGDEGKPFVYHQSDSAAARAFQAVVKPVIELIALASETGASAAGSSATERQSKGDGLQQKKGEKMKRFAIPIANGKLCSHFGHCEEFALLDVAEGKIAKREDKTPPPHEPGVLPKWLGELAVDVIIAGGMGQRAQDLFKENGIEVCVGAASAAPEDLVEAWLAGSLKTGTNLCDH